MNYISEFQKQRYKYSPKIPKILEQPSQNICTTEIDTEDLFKNEAISEFFPNTKNLKNIIFTNGKNKLSSKKQKIGVVLSGGQAPGGHNVISGIFDSLKSSNENSELFGFLMGPQGLINGDYKILNKTDIDMVRNTGGFDLIGSGRTKIESESQISEVIKNIKKLDLDALIIIGGDDSNTNAAVLSEIFLKNNIKTKIIGIPKTIDGDLKNNFVEVSFGFDTACKFYSSLIGNLARDTVSAKKYWNIVKLMGRSASHITLECALQVHPNITLIGEEISKNKTSLNTIIENICNVIIQRAEKGLNYGIILIPEGIIEFIPETKKLITELNNLWDEFENQNISILNFQNKKNWLKTKLSKEAYSTLTYLPEEFANQFLGLRDPHGNIVVSKIETDKIFTSLIEERLSKETQNKHKISILNFFYGYEGRALFPTNFDANYCYALGKTAFLLALNNKTGYMACIKNLSKPPAKWQPYGIPLVRMMTMENRIGKQKPVIEKTLVNLNGKPYLHFLAERDNWILNEDYIYPETIQYFGPNKICNKITTTLMLESQL